MSILSSPGNFKISLKKKLFKIFICQFINMNHAGRKHVIIAVEEEARRP